MDSSVNQLELDQNAEISKDFFILTLKVKKIATTYLNCEGDGERYLKILKCYLSELCSSSDTDKKIELTPKLHSIASLNSEENFKIIKVKLVKLVAEASTNDPLLALSHQVNQIVALGYVNSKISADFPELLKYFSQVRNSGNVAKREELTSLLTNIIRMIDAKRERRTIEEEFTKLLEDGKRYLELQSLFQEVKKIILKIHSDSDEKLKTLEWYLDEISVRKYQENEDEIVPILSYIVTLGCNKINTKKSSVHIEALFEKAKKFKNEKYKDCYDLEEDTDEIIYEHDMQTVWNVIAGLIDDQEVEGMRTATDEDWLDNFIAFLKYLKEKEDGWKKEKMPGLPPVHSRILELSRGSKTLLIEFIVSIANKSQAVFVKDGDLVDKSEFESLKDKTEAQILAILGTSLSCGLSVLPFLLKNQASIDNAVLMFRFAFAGETYSSVAAQSSAVLSSTNNVLPYATGAIIGGICVYNAWKALRKEINWRKVGQNIFENIAKLAIGYLVCYGAIVAIGATTPVGLALSALAGIAIVTGVNRLLHSLIERFTRWLFGISKEDALAEAYKILGVKKTATMEEVESAARKLSREYHPDHLRQKGSSQDEVEQALPKFLKVREALGIIKLAKMEQEQED